MDHMKKFVFICFLCIAAAVKTQAVCKEGWEEFAGHCYFLSGNPETWHKAMELCTRENGHLVRINSNSENLYIQQRARSTSANIWIDGTDEAQEGTWVYGSTQGPLGFTDWNSGQPNNNGGNANCLGLYQSFNYKWDDDDCTGKRHFFCEKEPETDSCSRCCCCGH